MKKTVKIVLVIVTISVITLVCCFQASAFESTDYAALYGQLTNGNTVMGSGIYGGIFVTHNNENMAELTDYYRQDSNNTDRYFPSSDFVSYTLSITSSNITNALSLFIPYATNRYIRNIEIKTFRKNQIIGEVDGISEISDIRYSINKFPTVEMVGLYRDWLGSHPYTYTNTNSNQDCILIQMWFSSDIPVDSFVTVSFEFSDYDFSMDDGNVYGYFDDVINSNLNNALGVYGGLVTNITGFTVIQLLITVSIILSVMGIAFNWLQSL